MSLLDEWNSEINTTELRQSSTAQSAGLVPNDALFGLEQRAEFLCRWAAAAEQGRPRWGGLAPPAWPQTHLGAPCAVCRGRGIAVAFAAANDALFVATSRVFLLRHDVSGVTNAGEAAPPPPPPAQLTPARGLS